MLLNKGCLSGADRHAGVNERRILSGETRDCETTDIQALQQAAFVWRQRVAEKTATLPPSTRKTRGGQSFHVEGPHSSYFNTVIH